MAFTDPIISCSVLLPSQSGRAESPHYIDRARLWSQGVVRPTYIDEEQLRAHVVGTRTIERGAP